MGQAEGLSPEDAFEFRLEAALLNDDCPFCEELMINGRCFMCGHDPSTRGSEKL